MRDDKVKAVEKGIRNMLRFGHGTDHAFFTLMELMALSISCTLPLQENVERLQRLEELRRAMQPDELEAYAELVCLLGEAIIEHTNAPSDILGRIFHGLSLHDKWKGQFFTPDHICRFMAHIVGLPKESELSAQKPYTVCDSCCGSGAMFIGYLNALREEGLDYSNGILMKAQDIDIRCVWMCYIQLSLYGVPAVVVHGNSLTMEEWSYWFTPAGVKMYLESSALADVS